MPPAPMRSRLVLVGRGEQGEEAVEQRLLLRAIVCVGAARCLLRLADPVDDIGELHAVDVGVRGRPFSDRRTYSKDGIDATGLKTTDKTGFRAASH